MTPRSFWCRAIVFDLDGVLADSTHAVNRSWETWSERHGIDPQRAIRIGHGRTPRLERCGIPPPPVLVAAAALGVPARGRTPRLRTFAERTLPPTALCVTK